MLTQALNPTMTTHLVLHDNCNFSLLYKIHPQPVQQTAVFSSSAFCQFSCSKYLPKVNNSAFRSNASCVACNCSRFQWGQMWARR